MIAAICAAATLVSANIGAISARDHQFASHFTEIRQFSGWKSIDHPAGSAQQWESAVIKLAGAWNELVLSWNIPGKSTRKWIIEARAISTGLTTRYYTMAKWTPTPGIGDRESVKGQQDVDGRVDTDTLTLAKPATAVQVRIVAIGADEPEVAIQFLGVITSNTSSKVTILEPNRKAWGKVIDVPEKCQLSYEGGRGWCSPASVSMVINHWAKITSRPDLAQDVPVVAEGALDPIYGGTGNWPFNTAYAGSFPGIRAYVTRFTDVSELEDWITKGIPVICSVSYRLLKGLEKPEVSGHIVVCVGFTKDGDVIMNDPWAHLDQGEKVRKIFKRKDLIAGWGHSHNTVYLIYPVDAKIPKDRLGHWDRPGH